MPCLWSYDWSCRNLGYRRSRTKHFLHRQSEYQNIFDSTLLDEEFERQKELNLAKVSALSACDQNILWVCVGCQEIADELQEAFTELKISKNNAMGEPFGGTSIYSKPGEIYLSDRAKITIDSR